jgi:hypothetical protein
MTMLHPGDRFPTLTVPLMGGGTVWLPDVLAGGRRGPVLPGRWCPYCNAQLRAFELLVGEGTSRLAVGEATAKVAERAGVEVSKTTPQTPLTGDHPRSLVREVVLAIGNGFRPEILARARRRAPETQTLLGDLTSVSPSGEALGGLSCAA